MALEIDRTASNGDTLIKVTGEVDLYTSPKLRSAVLEETSNGDGDVEVDLSGVGYMDSSGVATLVEALRSARDHEVALRLRAPSPAVTKVLKLAKLDSVFEIVSEP